MSSPGTDRGARTSIPAFLRSFSIISDQDSDFDDLDLPDTAGAVDKLELGPFDEHDFHGHGKESFITLQYSEITLACCPLSLF